MTQLHVRRDTALKLFDWPINELKYEYELEHQGAAFDLTGKRRWLRMEKWTEEDALVHLEIFKTKEMIALKDRIRLAIMVRSNIRRMDEKEIVVISFDQNGKIKEI